MATLTTPDEGMRQDFQAGLGLAQGFMQNYWKAKEGQIEQERYRAGQALRDVQLSLYQTNLETVRNAAVLDAQAKAAVPRFMSLMARSQVNGYDDDSQRLVFEFGEQNPGIINSPLWKMQIDNYNASKKAQQEKEEFDRRIEAQLKIAEMRNPNALGPNGQPITIDVENANGKKFKYIWTGNSYQPVGKDEVSPDSRATPLLDTSEKPVPGKYIIDGKVISAQENVYSVFGGGGQSAPASTAVAPGDTKAPTVLKFDKTGKPIK